MGTVAASKLSAVAAAIALTIPCGLVAQETASPARQPKSIFIHYAKHVKGVILDGGTARAHGRIDMPEFKSFGEYRTAAREFVNGPRGRDVVEGTRPNGDMFRHDRATSNFGVRTQDGFLRTFFRRDEGEADYIGRQWKSP